MQKMSAFIALYATSGAAIPVARSLPCDSPHTEYVPNRSIAERRSFGVMRATEQPHHSLCRPRGQSCEPGVCSSDFLNPPLNQVWPRLHQCPGGGRTNVRGVDSALIPVRPRRTTFVLPSGVAVAAQTKGFESALRWPRYS